MTSRRAVPTQPRRSAVRVRELLHDRRFWLIQALVVAISVAHTSLETSESFQGKPLLHLIPISTYFVPAMYASLNFGLAGAIPTVLWSWLSAVPGIVLFHGSVQRTDVTAQFGIMLITAVLVARQVEREREATRQADAVNTRLLELNAVAAAASQSLVTSRVFSETLGVILHQAAAAWIVYAPEGWGTRSVTSLSGSPPVAVELSDELQEVTRRVVENGGLHLGTATEETPLSAPAAAVVPIRVGDRVVGALGIVSRSSTLLSSEAEQLSAIARQLGLALGNIQHFQEARRALAELSRTKAALENYLRLATEAQEEERKRLARGLHDGTIQSLVITKGYLETAFGREQPDKANVAKANEMLARTIDELRRLSRDLRPPILDDLGLVKALESLVAEFTDRTSVPATVDIEGAQERLDQRTELVLYRVAQEALRNVEKHAAAGGVHVTLGFGPAGAILRVADDGCGFEARDVLRVSPDSLGLGLRGMQERAKLVGGTLTIESCRGGGTCVEVRAPGH